MKQRIQHIILILLLLFGNSNRGYAEAYQKLSDAVLYLNFVDSLLHSKESIGKLIRLKPTSDSLSSQAVDHLVEQQKRAYVANSGVYATFLYNYKLGAKGADDSMEEISSYTNRAYLMLTWEFLQSGFIGRSLAFQEIDLKGGANYNDLLNKKGLAEWKRTAIETETQLNGFYNNLLELRLQMLEVILALQSQLVSDEKVLLINAMDIRHKMVMLQGKMREDASQDIKQKVVDLSGYARKQKHVEEADIDSFINELFVIKQREIQMLLLENKYEVTKPIKEMKLAPFVRGQYYDRNFGQSGRTNIDIGISFTMPIEGETKYKRSEIKGQMEILRLEIDDEKAEIKAVLLERIRRLNQNLVLLNQLIAAQTLYEERLSEVNKLFNSQRISIQEAYLSYDSYIESMQTLYDLVLSRELMLLEFESARFGIYR